MLESIDALYTVDVKPLVVSDRVKGFSCDLLEIAQNL